MTPPDEPLRPIRRKLVRRGAKFDFEVLTFKADDGRDLEREVVRHPGSVVILPILDDQDGQQVVFVRNERLALGKRLLELPAGTLEPPETPDACARRELAEETGYEAATWTPLGRFYTTPGMTDEFMHAYAAAGLRHVGQRLEADERLTVQAVPVAKALAMVGSGELTDAKTMLVLLLASQRGLIRAHAGDGPDAAEKRSSPPPPDVE